MKVLLTGANGFVGSHILDSLWRKSIPAAILLRPGAGTGFIKEHIPHVEVRTGSIDDAKSLEAALHDVTHVLHGAGRTKALHPAEYFETNQFGTRRVVEAVNRRGGQIQRLVHISSLAAGGPAIPGRPVVEEDPPRPVSPYGESKLAGEREITSGCKTDFVILRPPAVYGPRDGEFLRLFQATKAHLSPRFGGGKQLLSLVFVRDLAEAAVECLTCPLTTPRVFYAACREIVTALDLAREIARQMQTWTIPLSLPTQALWPVCCLQEFVSNATGKANVLNRAKYAELREPAWVCDPSRFARELGITCPTQLHEGVRETLLWYRAKKWL
jgi:nucleoside-diphosphate-sugar epimerase